MTDPTSQPAFDARAVAESCAYGAGYWLGQKLAEQVREAGDHGDDYFSILMAVVLQGAAVGLAEQDVPLGEEHVVVTQELIHWLKRQASDEGYRAAQAEQQARAKRRPIAGRVRLAVFERDAYRCVVCQSWEDLTIDHIHPVVAGGGNDIDNLQTMCRPCNSTKGTRVGDA